MPQRITFTKAAIAGIRTPPSGARVTVYDVEIPKLAVRVTSAGTRTFYVVTWRASGVAWVKLGTFPDMTIEQARKAADSALGQFADGTDPAEAKRTKRAQMTL